ncbi:MAG TPA: penicillin-binding transpeptidase domain-containing protein, partial [Pyrinomonadaceae bacterium]
MLSRRQTTLRQFFLRSHTRTLFILLMTAACVAVVLASFSHRKEEGKKGQAQASLANREDETDAALERAAREALGSQDGTIIVMDAQSGRLRAVVNDQMAFQEGYAPGSTIKPFTALAALRLHQLDERTRRLCRTRYTYKDLDISCPHQKTDVAFNLTQALAYSCNYFFGKVGER